MNTSMTVLTFLAGVALTAGAQDVNLLISPAGKAECSAGGHSLFSLVPGLYADGWRGASAGMALESEDGVRRSAIQVPGGPVVDTELRVAGTAEKPELRFRLTPREDAALNSLHIALDFPANILAGASFTADGEQGTVPAERGETHLRGSTVTRSLSFSLPGGTELTFDLLTETEVLLQDSRQWGPSFTLRLGPQCTPARVFKAGEPLEIAFALSSTPPLRVELDGPVTLAAGDEWIPLQTETEILEGSALDLTGLATDAPAGKHGRVVARGSRFEFEKKPGTPLRFYGVNLCFSAHFLSREDAERLAARLARLGYNTVRFHHHDNSLVTRADGSSTVMHAENLDKLDYLFFALKKRGLYVTTDGYVSRRVFAGEVYEGATGDLAMNEFKMLVPVNEKAFANWQEYVRNFLTHVNPYTEMRYADDPCLAWLSLINEGNFGNFISTTSDRAKADWRKAWSRWLLARHGAANAVAKAWGEPVAGDLETGTAEFPGSATADSRKSREFALFLADTQRAMYRRIRTFLRDEIGTQVLLTDMNGWTNTCQSQLARDEFDFVDDHFYVDHPQFLEQDWRLPSSCPNTSPIAGGSPGGLGNAFRRPLDKPFTISEYNYSGPGRFRGVGGILTGCIGSVQDWSAIWRFAYSHSNANLFAPSTAGYFDLVTDPLNQAAERAGLFLFLRGDMAPAPFTIGVTMDRTELEAGNGRQGDMAPSWRGLATVTKVGTWLADPGAECPADVALPADAKSPAKGVEADVAAYGADTGKRLVALMRERRALSAGNITEPELRRLQSANDQFTMDSGRDMMVLDTPRTAGGYARSGETIETNAVRIDIRRTDATVWVSALDDRPIANSRRLLVTHLTDLQNTGARFGERARKTLLAWGSLPHLVLNGEAGVTLTQAATGQVQAWVLNTSGKRLVQVPCRRTAAGGLELDLQVKGDEGARMLYEILIR